ncbi:unnamed protein product [Durusdinium trenchii]|uniref:Cysteine dioxygenase n=1 Tax=Durusdinium trenchii TaxID=1381693 RepID=A0ABP0LJW3_9DINO
MVWAIPSGTIHSFHTDSDELNVIAYHPDTDWGPMDENHPMLNRTWVDGEKIDNTRGRHERADLFQTEQSLVQLLWTYPIQRLELDERDEAKQMQERSWNFGIAILDEEEGPPVEVRGAPGRYRVSYQRSEAGRKQLHVRAAEKVVASVCFLVRGIQDFRVRNASRRIECVLKLDSLHQLRKQPGEVLLKFPEV